ncbi:hypothetical protein DL771_007958 [Monosporascus sp. 5C6A]|nr:hypothetical protein DL771_007958 [Monosporascus sp. 5C6A]
MLAVRAGRDKVDKLLAEPATFRAASSVASSLTSKNRHGAWSFKEALIPIEHAIDKTIQKQPAYDLVADHMPRRQRNGGVGFATLQSWGTEAFPEVPVRLLARGRLELGDYQHGEQRTRTREEEPLLSVNIAAEVRGIKALDGAKEAAKITIATSELQSAATPFKMRSFVAYEDDQERAVRFRVNTDSDRFKEVLNGHLISQTYLLCPSTLQLDIAVDALAHLQPERAKHTEGSPRLSNMPTSSAGSASCQVAGISINSMTERAADEMYISNRVAQWIRSPRSQSSRPDTWDVYSSHHKPSAGGFLGDIFVFGPRDGGLLEVIIGIHCKKVSRAGLGGALARLTGMAGTNPATPPVPLALPVAARVREMMVGLSGLGLDAIENDSGIPELGIDSFDGDGTCPRDRSNFFHELLEEVRLIELDESGILRTAVLLQQLLADSPVHKYDHKVFGLTGVKLADCLTGKADGLQILFARSDGELPESDIQRLILAMVLSPRDQCEPIPPLPETFPVAENDSANLRVRKPITEAYVQDHTTGFSVTPSRSAKCGWICGAKLKPVSSL